MPYVKAKSNIKLHARYTDTITVGCDIVRALGDLLAFRDLKTIPKRVKEALRRIISFKIFKKIKNHKINFTSLKADQANVVLPCKIYPAYTKHTLK